MTTTEQDFLDHVAEVAGYWGSDVIAPAFSGMQERLDGLAFSILVLLDGGTDGGSLES